MSELVPVPTNTAVDAGGVEIVPAWVGNKRATWRPSRPRMLSYDAVYRQAFRYPPWALDKLLQQLGYDPSDDMLAMAACRAPFNLKRCAILRHGWEIVPTVTDPSDTRHRLATEYADFVRWTLSNMRSPNGLVQEPLTLLYDMLRACWQGFRVGEIVWRLTGEGEGPYPGCLAIDNIAVKHNKQIGFDLDNHTGQIVYITSYTPGGALPYDPNQSGLQTMPDFHTSGPVMGGYDFTVPVEKCLIYSVDTESSLPHGNGDWRACYKHHACLNNIMAFWAIALERWGAPVFLLFAPGEDDESMSKVQTQADSIRQGSSAVIPAGLKTEAVSFPSTVFEGFKVAADWHTQQIALNILANSLTTTEGQHGGNRALGGVHQDTGNLVYEFIRRTLEGAFATQVIERLLAYNVVNYDR